MRFQTSYSVFSREDLKTLTPFVLIRSIAARADLYRLSTVAFVFGPRLSAAVGATDKTASHRELNIPSTS